MGESEPERGDGGETHGGTPERTCAVTREVLAPDDLIRFVVGPGNTIFPDVGHRLPGRGVWVGLSRSRVAEAARRNVFSRSLKRPATVPEGLADQVTVLLRRRVVEALSLANKAGLVVAGFTKVDVAIARGEVVALAHASEGATDGIQRLDRKLAAVSAGTGAGSSGVVTIVMELTSAELSLALGRQNVVHAGLRAGGATRHFLTEAGRLKRYLADSHGEAGQPPHERFNTEQV
jgi:predicted RNA-binding protein YlxR (DUF448 family)